MAKKLPIIRPKDASQLENAVTNGVPSKNPPVYIIPITQHIIRLIIGNTRSITFPFPLITSSLDTLA